MAEARLNLVIHHLKHEDNKEAYDLIKDLQPSVPAEYVLKGVVNAVLGQELNSVRSFFQIMIDNVLTIFNFVYAAGVYKNGRRMFPFSR